MATKVTTSPLGKLKAAIEAFEAAQSLYHEHGAEDTEPDVVFQRLLADVVNGKTGVKVPTTIVGWQLYKQKGAGQAAKVLATAANKVVNVIKNTTGDKLGPVRDYLREYCWRTGVN